ncbi:MAG: hypothetical protein QOG80_3515 [Pseudonocardiales bacterium]|jgi:hypothetical protein|nr:hypothetical protein [Pseudonocardiales bacterium]
MAESSKKNGKAAELAAQAAAVAGPIKTRATELAGAAAEAAVPMAAHAKERAVVIAERAGAIGAKGVSAAAEGIDKATGGRYSKQIASVTSRIEERIHPDEITPTPRTSGPQSDGDQRS